MIYKIMFNNDNSPIKSFDCVCHPQILGKFIIFITEGNVFEWKRCYLFNQDNIYQVWSDNNEKTN